MTEEQQPNLPHFEYFGVDRERVERGVEEVDRVLNSLDKSDKEKLLKKGRNRH